MIWSESLSVKIINKDGKVMEIIKIIGIALIALIIIIMLKQYRPEYAIFISILTGILILFLVIIIFCFFTFNIPP